MLDEEEEIEEEDKDNDKRDRSKCKSKPVVIQMVSPAQQSTEQAKAYLKREAEDRKKDVRPIKKRKKTSIV